jgi:hypothetical protein
MYSPWSPIFLRTENQLNKVLKQQKRLKSSIGVLFCSLWDPYSEKLVEDIRLKLTQENKKPLYIVDSFTMPHAFVIFKTTKLPHLVQFNRNGMASEDYLSKVYEELGL